MLWDVKTYAINEDEVGEKKPKRYTWESKHQITSWNATRTQSRAGAMEQRAFLWYSSIVLSIVDTGRAKA